MPTNNSRKQEYTSDLESTLLITAFLLFQYFKILSRDARLFVASGKYPK